MGLSNSGPIIDAHHHLWDLGACRYPWLMQQGGKRFFGDPAPIRKNYLLDDFLADIGDLPVQASVHVQVGAAVEDSVKETQWLQSVAEQPGSRGLPTAIVAFCDLAADDAPAMLEQHRQRAANLRGVRQIIGRAPEEDARARTGELLDNPRWRRGLGRVSALGLRFDLQLVPEQMARARQVFAALPDLKTALCHCGSPRDQSADGIAFWREGLRGLAELPNMYCKLSGFGMFDRDWSAASIAPLAAWAIDCFGLERCMFGSNFPVDKLYADYAAVWHAYGEIAAAYSAAERRRLFFDTAREFYGI